MKPRISVFPKCYFDPLVSGEMDYVAWIRSAPPLGGEGLEHYDGFFRSFRDADVDPVIAAMAETGQTSSMLLLLAGLHASRSRPNGRAR